MGESQYRERVRAAPADDDLRYGDSREDREESPLQEQNAKDAKAWAAERARKKGAKRCPLCGKPTRGRRGQRCWDCYRREAEAVGR